ncbi:MAG: hypothetical protein DRH70_01395 [Candidatus Coatesbacteria bacterium]|nr:MAG: hypothetical protein DRH70_01395 [Candidatus Coatesbacteria bacterium]
MGASRNRVLLIILFGVVFASLVYLAASSPSKPPYGTLGDGQAKLHDRHTEAGRHSESETTERAAVPSSKPADKVIVYYFHPRSRDFSGRLMESFVKDALEKDFGADLKRGRLVFRSVNTDKPENRHFIDDYGLHIRSVVLSESLGGRELRHKNLVRVWALLRYKDKLQKYIQGEVRAYLEAQ